MPCDVWGIDVADAVLRFDRTAGRWEYSIGDITTWVNTENPTALLQVARNSAGLPVGFTFDIDVSDSSFAESLNAIRREFGDDIAQRVNSEPIDDVELLITTSSSLVGTAGEGVDVMRQDARLQGASSDVVITDDSAAGVVTVTMTVPWWARFTKPWVAVRRRGKRDILLTGPMRIRGRTAKATLRYGMPYSGSTLTADVVRGPQRNVFRSWLAALVAAAILALGVWLGGWTNGDQLTVPSRPVPVVPRGQWIIERVEFSGSAQCLRPGDRFQVLGRAFDPESGGPLLYLAVWDEFEESIPADQLVPVPSRVDSSTRITAKVPEGSAFPVAPRDGELITVVLLSDPSAPLAFGNTVVTWCD